MRVSVFGIGYVGVVSSACLAAVGHEITAVDIVPEKIEMINRGQSPIIEDQIDSLVSANVRAGRLRATSDVKQAIEQSDISLISVGTPSKSDGSLSTDAVKSVLSSIGEAIRSKSSDHVIVMRSTVPPRTAEDELIPLLEDRARRRCGVNLTYYSNPEFLREGSSVNDFLHPPFTLIGSAEGDNASVLRSLYSFVPAPTYITDFRTAESVKYLCNVYHAVKLSFANEAGAILNGLGVDARKAFRIFCQDTALNISASYLRPGFAFGGSCLPKDIRAFLAVARTVNVNSSFLGEMLPSNQSVIQRAYEMIARHGRQTVSFFGLAFKPGTDDLRESPFVALAERLIGRGYELRIYDRSLDLARLVGSNRRYIESEIPHLDRLMVATPEEALQNTGIAVIGHIAQDDQPALRRALDKHIVIDLAGIDDLRYLDGISYQGLCW